MHSTIRHERALASGVTFVCNASFPYPTWIPMAESKKYQIAASAVPQFIADQSDPAIERYVFAYTITIENVGTVPAPVSYTHLDVYKRQTVDK